MKICHCLVYSLWYMRRNDFVECGDEGLFHIRVDRKYVAEGRIETKKEDE